MLSRDLEQTGDAHRGPEACEEPRCEQHERADEQRAEYERYGTTFAERFFMSASISSSSRGAFAEIRSSPLSVMM